MPDPLPATTVVVVVLPPQKPLQRGIDQARHFSTGNHKLNRTELSVYSVFGCGFSSCVWENRCSASVVVFYANQIEQLKSSRGQPDPVIHTEVHRGKQPTRPPRPNAPASALSPQVPDPKTLTPHSLGHSSPPHGRAPMET
jgi:hypothetical protein